MAGRPRTQLKKIARLELLARHIATEVRSGASKVCIDSHRDDDMAWAWRNVAEAAGELRSRLASVAQHMCRKLKLSRPDYKEKYQRKGYKLAVAGVPEQSDKANDDDDDAERDDWCDDDDENDEW